MTWLREIGMEFVDKIVKSDYEPPLTSLIESWSTLGAMKSGSRMIIENSPVESSKSVGIVDRAIQHVQEVIRTIRSTIQEQWEVKIDVTHSVWRWITEQAGFMLTRFQVGRDGKMAHERLQGNQQKKKKNNGLSFAEESMWKRRRARGPLGTFTCVREDGVYLGIKATTGEVILGEPEWCGAHKNGPEEDSEGKMGTKQRWR